MQRWLGFLAMVACACPSKPATTTGGSAGSGSSGSAAVVAPTNATSCAEIKSKIEAMYRAEAQQKEPNRVDEAVSDNTTMVMNDCNKDPAKLMPCLNKATTVAVIEKQCLLPLDDEGTEGEAKK